MALLNTLRFILDHPLNQGRRFQALRGFVAWQVRSRLASNPIPVELVDGLRLLVSRGQTGATGNVYAGLHEAEEMAFVLHLLREGDLFVDVGANIGSYTILACAAGASCVAFEPGPAAEGLSANVRFNNLSDRVQVVRAAAGSRDGEAAFTFTADTENHVATAIERGATMTVPLTTVDSVLAGRSPVAIKVDVEGFEREVLEGAARTLAADSLLAVILETNGSGARYGSSDAELHERMVAAGFSPCRYSPLSRELTDAASINPGANTIYMRQSREVAERVRSARRYRLSGGREI